MKREKSKYKSTDRLDDIAQEGVLQKDLFPYQKEIKNNLYAFLTYTAVTMTVGALTHYIINEPQSPVFHATLFTLMVDSLDVMFLKNKTWKEAFKDDIGTWIGSYTGYSIGQNLF